MKRLSLVSTLAVLLPLSAIASTYNFSSTATALTDLPHGSAVTWGLNGTNYTNLFNDINTGGKVVTSATLTISDIYDWTGETTDPADALFVNILTGLDAGIRTKAFSSGTAPSSSFSLAVNPFVDGNSYNTILQSPTALKFVDAQSGSLLKYTGETAPGTPAYVTWSDPHGGTGTPDTNLVIQFTADNLALLNTLLDADSSASAPNVGLGFAAECHYYMDGVSLSITTGTAPPPPSVPDAGSTLGLFAMAAAAMAALRRFARTA